MPCVLRFYKDGDETDSCADGDSENYRVFFSEITGFFSEILQVHEIGVNRSEPWTGPVAQMKADHRKHRMAGTFKLVSDLLLLVRQMETPVSPMKVAVHRRSLRLPYSLRATGVWSGQIPFLSGS